MSRFITLTQRPGGPLHIRADLILGYEGTAEHGTAIHVTSGQCFHVAEIAGHVRALIEGEKKVTPATMADLVAVADDMANELDSITDQLERVGDTRAHRDGQYINDARAVLERWEAARWPARKETASDAQLVEARKDLADALDRVADQVERRSDPGHQWDDQCIKDAWAALARLEALERGVPC